MPRKCLKHSDTFCYVCGELTFKSQRRNLTPPIEKCYELYFGCKDFDSSLYYAAAYGNLDEVQSIVDSGNYDINTQNPDGKSSLYIAAAWAWGNMTSNAYLEIAQLLIDYGADVNMYNRRLNTPLYVASAWAHPGMVELLIRSGAHLDTQMEEGRTPLIVAAFSRPHMFGFQKLNIQKHNSYYFTKMYLERIMRTNEYSQFLTEMEQHYNFLITHPPALPEENLPAEIMNIIEYYIHFETVALLVQAGANVNIADERGQTALSKAAVCGHLAMVKFLVANGANITLTDEFARTPRQLAADNGNWDVHNFLQGIEEEEN